MKELSNEYYARENENQKPEFLEIDEELDVKSKNTFKRQLYKKGQAFHWLLTAHMKLPSILISWLCCMLLR